MPAHPRVGGENRMTAAAQPISAGSSPRGRGKPWLFARQGHLSRLIPAWAGKTSARLLPCASSVAHPRVGGENAAAEGVYGAHGGSSPRGRGKHPHHRRLRRQPGLIPAWAGKTQHVSSHFLPVPAHPRVGGENYRGMSGVRPFTGSSPRGRGKRYSSQRVTVAYGLIPAWAGKTTR